MNKTIDNLEPKEIWSIFQKICSIPHVSGEEQLLASELEAMAIAHNLCCQRDAVGNLRIDRKAAVGMENSPHILMQAHLDMVPQSDDSSFDFSTTPITPRIDGEHLYATGTTLGADNGIGIAVAMALLLDSSLQCGKLSFLATIEEETGLRGATNLDVSMLECDYLLNLDSEEEGLFYIGCAGGRRLKIELPLDFQEPMSNFDAFAIELSGLLGGHSGCDIDKKRGNAILAVAQFLNNFEEIQLTSISGGSVDNAIPRSAQATFLLPKSSIASLSVIIQEFNRKLRAELCSNCQAFVDIASIELPAQALSLEQSRAILDAIVSTPIGVIEQDDDFNIPQTSNNLASVEIVDTTLNLVLSQRSLIDENCEALSNQIVKLYQSIGGSATVGSCYPGWRPQKGSQLSKISQDIYEEMFGVRPPLTVIHAGLECGIFAGKNPNMEIISFGPTIESPHSPQERVEIASVERFWKFLQQLICFISQ